MAPWGGPCCRSPPRAARTRSRPHPKPSACSHRTPLTAVPIHVHVPNPTAGSRPRPAHIHALPPAGVCPHLPHPTASPSPRPSSCCPLVPTSHPCPAGARPCCSERGHLIPHPWLSPCAKLSPGPQPPSPSWSGTSRTCSMAPHVPEHHRLVTSAGDSLQHPLRWHSAPQTHPGTGMCPQEHPAPGNGTFGDLAGEQGAHPEGSHTTPRPHHSSPVSPPGRSQHMLV